MPFVSIICAGLNGMPYISRMLNSVIEQSFEQWELIYIDDGSTDGSLEFMSEQARSDRRIKILQTSGNSGVSVARNLGLDFARGNYIGFLDVDDWFHPDKLSIQIKFISAQSCDFVASAYQICDEFENVIRYQPIRNSLSVKKHLSKIATIGTLTPIFDRVKFKKIRFDTDLRNAEDYYFWFTILAESEKMNYKVGVIDKPLAYYRLHSSSKSSNKLKIVRAIWVILRVKIGFPFFKSISIVSIAIYQALKNRLYKLFHADLKISKMDPGEADNFSHDLVSIIVPCRNEREYIDSFLENILSQKIIGFDIEILVADGLSDDGTRERIQDWLGKDNRLRLLDNPLKIVSSGLNIAIREAKGNLIVRMDVHTYYDENYILECVNALRESRATCVGGAWIASGKTTIERAIAAAFQSRIGSGNAASRKDNFTGWVDTVYLGAWRKRDLLLLGGFDESLVRNQDDELNFRIIHLGGKVWQSNAIRSIYTPRPSLKKLYLQFRQYGYWKIPVIRKYRRPASLRHIAPFIFLCSLIFLAVCSIFIKAALILELTLLQTYLLVLWVGSSKERASLDTFKERLLMLAAIMTMHIGYAIGFAGGIWSFLICGRYKHPKMTLITR